jgi:hypothetical protein
VSLSFTLSLFFSLAVYGYLYLFIAFPHALSLFLSLSLFIFLVLYFTFSFFLLRALHHSVCFFISILSAFYSLGYVDQVFKTNFINSFTHFCLFLFVLLSAFVSLTAYLDESLLAQTDQAMENWS